MENSVTLFAKEEKEKVQPAGVVRFSNTLSLNSSLKAVVDSVNKVKDIQIEKNRLLIDIINRCNRNFLLCAFFG